MQDMENQRWLVTGASRGIGRAIGEAALARGSRVAMLARGDIVQEDHGDRALLIRGDVTDHQSMADVAATIKAEWGGIDVLVNNAGLHRGGLVDRIDFEDFDEVVKTNLNGPLNTIRSMLPHFGKEGGAIVNIGAVVGFRGFAGDAAYGSSKMALAGLTQVLAVELARRAIRVNLVIPGFVSTEMTAEIPANARERLEKKIPLGRQGTPAEIAEVVWWVAQSTYMTGSTVATDGGLMCGL